MMPNPTKAWLGSARQATTRAEQRSYFTHVGLICNDPAIQPRLPQVLFVSSNLLTLAGLAAIQASLPDNVFVKRMPRGWNNAEEHCVIIRLLRLVLEP